MTFCRLHKYSEVSNLKTGTWSLLLLAEVASETVGVQLMVSFPLPYRSR